MRDVLYCGETVIYTSDKNEYFTGYILRKELNNFCEKYLEENSETILEELK